MGGTKFKIPSKDDRRHDEMKPQSPVLEPFHKQILRRNHADREEFDAKSFPFEELIPRWKGQQFDPHLMNAATGRIFSNKHHTKGEGTKKRANFEAFDFGFCLEWIDRTVDGVTFRDRCYNQFTIKSPGCYDHPNSEFKEGPNAVYYRLLRGDTCNWGMLKDTQASVQEDGKKFWTYVDWRNHAIHLAQTEQQQAAEQGKENYRSIVADRMAEFEAWWRLEAKKDAQQGGAQAANARGYSLMGTRTDPPDFMSHEAAPPGDLLPPGHDAIPSLSRLTLNETTAPRVANIRQKFGQDASNGRPDLEAKRTNQQNKGKKTKATALLPENGKDDFFSRLQKDRKPRHADKDGGRAVGA